MEGKRLEVEELGVYIVLDASSESECSSEVFYF